MPETIRISLQDAKAAVECALAASGASAEHARATGRSIIAAEAEGNRAVGLAHLFDYLSALDAGRADGSAVPVIEPDAGVIRIDARQGMPHLGVDIAWPQLVTRTRDNGVAILALRNGFTCGALGYFARRLADEHALAALVAANAGPPAMPASGGKKPVFCTNPLAFAMPCDEYGSILIDQSSTAGAMVGIHQAKAARKPIPEGWALDADGNPTTDPAPALAGTLLPFGGYRGANIALMVELLAAGLTGGNWSHAAPAFNSGDRCPAVGLLIIAIEPGIVGGRDATSRVKQLIEVIRQDPGAHIPGLEKRQRAVLARSEGIEIDADLWKRVIAYQPRQTGSTRV